jgi:hypothetical protein
MFVSAEDCSEAASSVLFKGLLSEVGGALVVAVAAMFVSRHTTVKLRVF